jgi:hypothetical protein
VLGTITAPVVCTGQRLLDRLHIDDPVGAIAVHGIGGILVGNGSGFPIPGPWDQVLHCILGMWILSGDGGRDSSRDNAESC